MSYLNVPIMILFSNLLDSILVIIIGKFMNLFAFVTMAITCICG